MVTLQAHCPLLTPSYAKDPYAKGEIFIGDSNEGYSVCIGVASGMKDFEQGHSFTLVTPGKSLSLSLALSAEGANAPMFLCSLMACCPTGRKWCFGAETAEERQQWMQALESVINKRSSVPNDAIKESTRSDLRDSYIKRSKYCLVWPSETDCRLAPGLNWTARLLIRIVY